MTILEKESWSILLALLLGFLILTSSGASSRTISGTLIKDFDGDGHRESKVFYVGGRVVQTLMDMNRDGVFDSVIYYKDGDRDRLEGDRNGDGRTDLWISYYRGTAWQIAEDLNGDGLPDYRASLKEGVIYKWEQDRNGDGKYDVKTVYDIGPGGSRKLAQQSYDDDFDGVFDSLSGMTILKRDADLPHSLAEALLR